MEKRNIQQLIKKNPSYAEGYQNIYPWTYTESVKDKETGELLDETLSRMNYFTLAYGGSEYDTRMQVPLKYRKKGTIISYLDYDNLLHVDFYSKDEIDDMSWVSDENWIPVFSYYNGFFTLPWKGSFEDTLLQINKAYRHWGMMITYNDGDDIPVHLKYLENNTDDTVFTNKDNWECLDRPAFLEWLRQTVANVLGDIHNYPSIMEEFNTWFREELIPVIDSKDATVLNSAKTYTNNQIKALIAGAPETLDTLKEIADLLEQHGEVIETLVTKEAFNTHVNNDSIHLTASDVNTILTNKTDSSVSTTSNKFITNSAITKYVNTSSTNAKNNAVATAKDSLSSWLVSGSDTITVSTQPEGAGLDVNSDTAMSDNSTNPVQNKIIKGYVDSKVSALDTKTSNADSNLSSRIDALATRVTTNEGSIASNTSNIASNTSDITSIEGDITTINSKINTTNSKVATNTSDISTLKSNVTSLSNTKADKNKVNTINNQSMLAGINMVIPIITVDATLDVDSTNAIQNAAVTTRFNATSESISNLRLKADTNESNISTLTNSKQDKLVSGTNIKTVNGNSLLGSGNVSIPVITVDSAISKTSTNPVQNKVISTALDTKQNKLTSSDTIFTLKDATNTMQVKYGNTIVSSSLILSTQDGIGLDVNFDTINSTSTKAVMSKTIYSYLTTNYAKKSNYVAKADVEDHFDINSTNPIQNAIISTWVNSTSNTLSTYLTRLDSLDLSVSGINQDITSLESNKVDKDALNTLNGKSLLGGKNMTYDTALSSTSTNAVQNKVINTALGTKQDKLTASTSLFSLKDSNTTTAIKYGSTLVSSSLITSTQTGGIGLDVNFGSITSDSTKAVMGKTIYTELSKKQDKLLSGTSIKTINNTSILGSGNISIPIITVDSAITSGSTNAVQSGAVYTANQNLANTVNTYHTELNDKITDLYSQLNTKQTTLVSGTNIKTINGASILGSGNITIEGGGGTSITVDDTLNDTSENPVQNKVIYSALLKKQDVIDFNNSDVYSSTQPNGVGIHLKASGVTAGTYGPSADTTGSSITIPKITVDSKGRITSAENTTFHSIAAATATKATQDGSGNIITSTYRTISASYSISDTKKLFDGNAAFGTSIPANADLNTVNYLNIGNYYCAADSRIPSLSNCPSSNAFTMRVISCRPTYDTSKNDNYFVREIISISGKKYIQHVTRGNTADVYTYGPWKKIVDSSDTLFKLKDSTNSTSYPLVLGSEILLAKNLVASTQGTGSVGLSINFGSVASGNTYAVSGGSVYTAINDAVSAKQDKLTSSTVLATINGNNLTYGGSLTIDGGGSSISVDNSLSTTSTNPVQNKVVTTNINSVKSDISTINSSISSITSDISTINSNINSINTSLSGKTTLNEVKNNINTMVVSGTLTTSTQPEGVGVDLKSGIITAGSYGPTADVTAGSSGASIVVPQITVDTYGRVTNIAHRSLKVDNYVKSITTGTGTIVYTTANGETSIVNIPNATTSASGYMSSDDKKKLNGIAAGATAVVVDSSLSSTSTNAIQNKAVYTGLSKKQDTIDFNNSDVYSSTQTNGVGVHIRMDSAMSSTSIKPVQNKVIKAYVDSTVSSAVSGINGSNYLLVNSSTNIQTIIDSSAYVIDIRASLTGSTGIPYTITGKKLIFNGGKLPPSDITFKNCEVVCPGQYHGNIRISDTRIMWSDCTFVTGQVFYNATTNKPLYYNGGWYTADGNSYAGNPESSF